MLLFVIFMDSTAITCGWSHLSENKLIQSRFSSIIFLPDCYFFCIFTPFPYPLSNLNNQLDNIVT